MGKPERHATRGGGVGKKTTAARFVNRAVVNWINWRLRLQDTSRHRGRFTHQPCYLSVLCEKRGGAWSLRRQEGNITYPSETTRRTNLQQKTGSGVEGMKH